MKKSKHAVSIVFVAFIAVFAVLLWALPDSGYSQNEKRVLSDFPEVTFETVTSGQFSKDIETYTSDQFPFREQFVGINSIYELASGRNGSSGVYKSEEGYLIATPQKLDAALCERNIVRFSQFAEQTGLPASMMIVPTAGYTLEELLPRNHDVYHDDEIFDIAEKNKGDIALIDIRKALDSSEEQVYYKTDHHVNTAGSYIMYREFADKAGFEPVTQFGEVEVLEGFYGTNYSKSGLWNELPDTVELWHSATGNEFEVTIDDTTEKKTSDSLYFMDHNENMDKYPVFLDGNHALTVVKNKTVNNGEKILIIKDSYAHCFATFLCENYEEVHMIDLRYYRGAVSDYAQENGITELLFLYGSDNIASSTDTAWLK